LPTAWLIAAAPGSIILRPCSTTNLAAGKPNAGTTAPKAAPAPASSGLTKPAPIAPPVAPPNALTPVLTAPLGRPVLNPPDAIDVAIGVKYLASDGASSAPLATTLAMPATGTIVNFILKRLLGKMDEKTAIALATELANPASAAKAIERSMVKRASQEINNQYARNALRPITMGGVNALAGQE